MFLTRCGARIAFHVVHLVDWGVASARRIPARHSHRWRRARSALRFVPLLSLLLPLWACGFGSWGGGVGARPLPVTHRPASQLRLEIQFTGQYQQYGDRPSVVALIRVFEGTDPTQVSFAEQAQLTCNGSDLKLSPTNVTYPCPPQPSGGSYQFVYTDEHGASTTAVVPIPTGSFAIVSPPAGATVPIPTNGLLTIRYAAPIPPPNGSVAIDNVSASCHDPALIRPCSAVFASLQHNATSTPGAPLGLAAAAALPASRTPNLAPGATPTPGATSTSGVGGSATVTQSSAGGTILLMGDFSRFERGPGSIELSVEAHVPPDRGGFSAVTAAFVDTISASITWER